LVERLEQAIRDAVPEWSLAEVVTASQAMRGIDLVAAVTVLAEIGDLSRFQTPRELMGYLGLVPSESSTGPMPRTAVDVVADLHALLRAAGVPGPYVFAGHSLGGLFVRLYASTYPRDVVGLVLVDAYSEKLETLLTPQQWAALVRLNVRSGSDTAMPIPSYGDLETIGYGNDNLVMRRAATTTPLGPMPLDTAGNGSANPETAAAFSATPADS
jgi:pimeloyl-ACP methyl ester carboxylesterase